MKLHQQDLEKFQNESWQTKFRNKDSDPMFFLNRHAVSHINVFIHISVISLQFVAEGRVTNQTGQGSRGVHMLKTIFMSSEGSFMDSDRQIWSFRCSNLPVVSS